MLADRSTGEERNDREVYRKVFGSHCTLSLGIRNYCERQVVVVAYKAFDIRGFIKASAVLLKLYNGANANGIFPHQRYSPFGSRGMHISYERGSFPSTIHTAGRLNVKYSYEKTFRAY